MPRYETRAVLAGRYVTASGPHLTHVLHTRELITLCGRVSPSGLADRDATDTTAVATCKCCAARDPREPKGPNDGPRCLKHILQF